MDSILPQNHWTQINYNITFEINCTIIDVNIHWYYLFFVALYTDNWKLRCVVAYANDFELTITYQ